MITFQSKYCLDFFERKRVEKMQSKISGNKHSFFSFKNYVFGIFISPPWPVLQI